MGKEVTVFIQIIIRPPALGRNGHVSSRDLELQLATIYGPFPLSFEGGSDLYRGENVTVDREAQSGLYFGGRRQRSSSWLRCEQ